MAGLNKVTIIGNLGKDPEVRVTPGGLCVCNFSVAVSEKTKDKEHTEWFDVTAFGKLGEIASKYLKKGKTAYVEGRLETRKFEINGQQRSKTSLIAKDVIFLSGAPRDVDQPSQVRKPGQQSLSNMIKGIEYDDWNDT